MCKYTYIVMKKQALFFKALGDETRLKIVSCLLDQESCACDFTKIAKKDQSTISRHLKILVEANILKFKKDGRNIIYSIKNEKVRKLLTNLEIKNSAVTESKEEIRSYHTRYLRAVNNPLRRKILGILNQEHSTFEDLQTKMSIDKNILKWHLDILEHGFCVEKQIKQAKLIYKITQEGKLVDFLEYPSRTKERNEPDLPQSEI